MFINLFRCKILSVLIGRKSLNPSYNVYKCSMCSGVIFADFTNFSKRNSLVYPILINSRSMAGHSKWQNIKHIKAEKDRQKNLMCNKYVRLVTQAIREKGPDPKMNNKLANLLEDAKKHNVPAGTLDSALKRANNKKLKPGTIEILGPGGCYMIIDYETDNISEMRHTLKVLCKKYSCNIMSGEGRWRASYEQKGIIKVTSLLNGSAVNSEEVLDAAIEAGAEDVQKRDEENCIYYEFLTAPDDLHIVKKELEKNYAVEEAYIGYVPISTVSLSDNDMVLADKFLGEMGDLPDVIRMFENIE